MNGAPNVVRKRDLLTPQRIAVRAEGELVVFSVGSTEMKMDHMTAFQVAAWLRLHANRAKRAAGDQSRLVTCIGHLSDANERR